MKIGWISWYYLGMNRSRLHCDFKYHYPENPFNYIRKWDKHVKTSKH